MSPRARARTPSACACSAATAGALGPLAPDDEVRAMLTVHLNQLLAGGTAIDAAVLEALAQALSGGHIPTVHELGAIAPVTSAPSPNWV
ncbi:aromatic amino acid lyase [Streptomyces sp. NPDC055105]|uniref:aromatic amino acid lyase n=1 Tax=Streptomyces sp. NPDC055105 TaxID=3365719 RepID=UPI0037D8B90A